MDKDILVTMQEDLRRALAKPPERRRWAMLLDLRKCVGCHACSVACASENKLPPGLWYRPVFEHERGKYPKVSRTFLPRPCMQCDEPPCVGACPVKGRDGATWKETRGAATGLVVIDYAKCIGCGQCVPACPYGARTLDDGSNHSDGTPAVQPYEAAAAFEYGRRRQRKGAAQPVGNARKCHFCVHRLQEGQLPQCISTCIGRAGCFGDESDPESLIARVKKASKVQILLARKGTAPRVYYVANEKLEAIHG
ncbi:MAG TPA: 4Fe-4S dicluster domain-containing protein [Anaeromyxobacteraceae bacterium]|nr:4Fe-4S dicluster domain-containing protein [Anaeromyxobacteraceae bacterium]